MEKTNTIKVNDDEYDVSELDAQTLYYVNQVRDLKSRITQARFTLDQLVAAENAFSNALISSLDTDSKENNNNAS